MASPKPEVGQQPVTSSKRLPIIIMDKRANLPKVRCPPLAAPAASFAPTKQTKRKPSGVPFFVVADRGGAREEGGDIQHVV